MRITLVVTALSALAAGACMDETEPVDEIATEPTADEAPTPEEIAQLPLVPEFPGMEHPFEAEDAVDGVAPYTTRYCVNQSSAAADYVVPPLFMTCSSTNWDSRLSYNHPVHLSGCGSSTYVLARSLWNGRYYLMRRDAFRVC